MVIPMALAAFIVAAPGIETRRQRLEDLAARQIDAGTAGRRLRQCQKVVELL